MDKKFTIEEFRNYLETQESMGDIWYNLSETNVEKANEAEYNSSEEHFEER